jgi:hypothetical protein
LFAVGFNLLLGTLFLYASLHDSKIDWVAYFIVLMFLPAFFYQYRLWQQEKANR